MKDINEWLKNQPGIITYNGLQKLVADGVIENVPKEHVNAASIDLTLADGFWFEHNPGRRVEVHLGRKEKPVMTHQTGRLCLEPGEFALAGSEQIFNLPNDISMIYVLKSSMARAGMNHLNAGYCDPGWNGSALTMEFHNVLRFHSLVMEPGDKCGQVYAFRGEAVPDLASYAARGSYNGDKGVQQSKGMR